MPSIRAIYLCNTPNFRLDVSTSDPNSLCVAPNPWPLGHGRNRAQEILDLVVSAQARAQICATILCASNDFLVTICLRLKSGTTFEAFT